MQDEEEKSGIGSQGENAESVSVNVVEHVQLFLMFPSMDHVNWT